MKKLIMGGAVILSSGFAGIAVAAPITWDTIHNSSSTADSCSGIVAGNSCTFDKGGEILSARAYSTNNTNGSGAFEKATIKVYDGGGIGVRSPGESAGPPNHATDNNGKDEMVVFEYDDKGYKPTGFEIGWKNGSSGDSDIRAWIGGETLAAGYDFTDKHFSDLSGLGFTLINNFYNVPINTFMAFNTNDTGRYLILAPQQIGNGFDSRSDYFKISQISGTAAVPEPGTAALLGIALAGFWANRRRKS